MTRLTRTGLYTPYENGETAAYLEVYRLSQDTLNRAKEEHCTTDTIMEMLGFSNNNGIVEPGAPYSEYYFVALNEVTGILVIEVQESLNI